MIQIHLSRVLPSGAFSIATFGNKSYVVPAWIEVPNGTTFSDIEIVGKPERKKPLRVSRILDHPSAKKSSGRMLISGTMKDVCAELDRLVMLENKTSF